MCIIARHMTTSRNRASSDLTCELHRLLYILSLYNFLG